MRIIEDKSPGHLFTLKYSQPEDYHFCLDSILTPKFVAETFSLPDQATVLDLCAGCGVIGFEYLFQNQEELKKIKKVAFIEKQIEFQLHYNLNRNLFAEKCKSDLQFEWISQSLSGDLELKEQFDLILCNPPYFFADEGKVPPNHFKAECHFFISLNPEILLRSVLKLLKSNGAAFILVKKPDKWQNAFEALKNDICHQKVAMIRGTLLVKVQKIA
ncbi:MAG: methyltransferase [Pseudobdellovibrionaceae bacterium]